MKNKNVKEKKNDVPEIVKDRDVVEPVSKEQHKELNVLELMSIQESVLYDAILSLHQRIDKIYSLLREGKKDEGS